MTESTDPRKQSDLERSFDTQFKRLGQDLPSPVPDFRFAPGRKYEFDRAFVDYRVAVELEGIYTARSVVCHICGTKVRFKKKDGVMGKVIRLPGYHQRYGRFKTDKEKYNLAVEHNWAVLRFLHDDVHGQPFEMVETIRRTLYTRRHMAPRVQQLTKREDQTLHLISAGFSGTEIAERLGVSYSTVRGHIANVLQKMVAHNQASAVARSVCWGLLRLNDIPWPDEDAEIYDLPGQGI